MFDQVLHNRNFTGFHPIWIKKRCERYGIYNQDIIGVGFLKHPVLVLMIRDFSGFSHVSFDFVLGSRSISGIRGSGAGKACL